MPSRGQADPEWLLWAQNFQIKQKQSIVDFNSQIQSITKEFNDKFDGLKNCTDKTISILNIRLDETNNNVSLLIEQNRDLTESQDHLQQDNDALKTRIQQLTQDLLSLDQSSSEERAGLSERIDSAHSRLRNMRDAGFVLDDWRKQAELESTKRDKQVDQLEAAIERMRAGEQRGPAERKGFRAESRPALTANSESRDEEAPMQVDKDPNIIIRKLATVPPQITLTLDITPQGRTSLEDYVSYGRRGVPEAFRDLVKQLEAETVKAFVGNLRDGNRQAELWKKMDEAGWAMENALKLMGDMASEITKKHPRRKRRRLN